MLQAFSYSYVLKMCLPVSCAARLFKVPKYLADMKTPEYELEMHVTGADAYLKQGIVNIVCLIPQRLSQP
jgi:hypothetical protein